MRKAGSSSRATEAHSSARTTEGKAKALLRGRGPGGWRTAETGGVRGDRHTRERPPAAWNTDVGARDKVDCACGRRDGAGRMSEGGTRPTGKSRNFDRDVQC
ncbi:hypothetical protein TRVL_04018 [Trypanosoma vivax]|nr:hypothetical protein TRVL_04018 [Trypanosoma vivax]